MSETRLKATELAKAYWRRREPPTVVSCLREAFSRRRDATRIFAIEGVSFSLTKGERVAVIGSNGSGKTTLLRIIAGIVQPTSGTRELAIKPRALFRFNIGLSDKYSVEDNLLLFAGINGIQARRFKERMPRILEFAGLPEALDMPLKDLSTGQFQRLALSAFMEVEDEFLLFDESFAFIDDGFARRCMARMDDWLQGKTMLLTSHDESILRRYCRKALWLERGKLMGYGDIEPILSEYRSFSGLQS